MHPSICGPENRERARAMMDETVKAFILEGYELLDQFDTDLVSLESDGIDAAVVKQTFRAVHTIKGTAGVLGFVLVESIAHVGESLLAAARSGAVKITSPMISALLALSDRLREEIVCIETTGSETGADPSDLLKTITELTPPAETEDATLPQPTSPTPVAKPNDDASPASASELVAETDAPMTPAAKPAAPAASRPAAPKPLTQDGVARATKPAKSAPSRAQSAEMSDSIHVRVDTLDNLINLVGELVLVRNQMITLSSVDQASIGHAAIRRLNTVAGLLQAEIIKTRMQPVGRLWGKMPRLVRDLAQSCGKEVELIMDGAETEVDRTVLESINAPLTHIIRNAVDHGIETPSEREAAGKDRRGRLKLEAFHRSGQVTICITDDGGGIDVAKLKERAIEGGFISRDEADRYGENELVRLMFTAGLSTAKQLTNVSGRGVGMDVVDANITRIGGSVDVRTARGSGTTVELRIPLTLSIIPALIITLDDQRYAIPQTSIHELTQVSDEERDVQVEDVHGHPVIRHRNQLIPVVYLKRAFGLEDGTPAGGEPGRKLNMVILQAHERRFAVIVDEILDYQEIVIKPLDKRLGRIGAYAGATIMGDGRAALILDVVRIAQMSNVVTAIPEAAAIEMPSPETERRLAARSILLMRGPDDGRLVLYLDDVEHLEDVPLGKLENVGGKRVLQYRGDVLQLTSARELLPERRQMSRNEPNEEVSPAEANVSIVICTKGPRTAGLIVDQIIDIIDAAPAQLGHKTRHGVKGTMLLDGRVCEVLDVDGILAAVEVGSADGE